MKIDLSKRWVGALCILAPVGLSCAAHDQSNGRRDAALSPDVRYVQTADPSSDAQRCFAIGYTTYRGVFRGGDVYAPGAQDDEGTAPPRTEVTLIQGVVDMPVGFEAQKRDAVARLYAEFFNHMIQALRRGGKVWPAEPEAALQPAGVVSPVGSRADPDLTYVASADPVLDAQVCFREGDRRFRGVSDLGDTHRRRRCLGYLGRNSGGGADSRGFGFVEGL